MYVTMYSTVAPSGLVWPLLADWTTLCSALGRAVWFVAQKLKATLPRRFLAYSYTTIYTTTTTTVRFVQSATTAAAGKLTTGARLAKKRL